MRNTRTRKLSLVATLIVLLIAAFMIGCSSEMSTNPMGGENLSKFGGNQPNRYTLGESQIDFKVIVNGVEEAVVNSSLTVIQGDDVQIKFQFTNTAGKTMNDVSIWIDGTQAKLYKQLHHKNSPSTDWHTLTVNTTELGIAGVQGLEIWERHGNKGNSHLFYGHAIGGQFGSLEIEVINPVVEEEELVATPMPDGFAWADGSLVLSLVDVLSNADGQYKATVKLNGQATDRFNTNGNGLTLKATVVAGSYQIDVPRYQHNANHMQPAQTLTFDLTEVCPVTGNLIPTNIYYHIYN